MDFKEQLSKRIQEAEEIIYSYLPQETGRQKIILEAMNYSVRAGGKRVRPILLMECCRMFGGRTEAAAPFMAALEYIHTYSLVHDDLPEMDNDELRRGMPTTHVKYGQAMAVLAGDGLLNYAYEIVAGAILQAEAPRKAALAFDILTSKAGIYGMVGGQVVDVATEGCANDKDTLDFIYELKTGALIQAAMMMGAVLGNADSTQLEQIEDIAGKVGMAFQIQDDILDVVGTTDELGKNIRSDEKNQKSTYVSLCGIEKASEYVRKLSEEAIAELKGLHKESDFLEEFLRFLIHRRK